MSLNQLKLDLFYKYFNKDWQHINEFLNLEYLPIIEEKKEIPETKLILDFLELETKGKIYIAGGSALYLYGMGRLKDFDIFITAKNKEEFIETYNFLIEFFTKKFEQNLYTLETKFTYTFVLKYEEKIKLPLQIIKKYYKSVSEILSNFDLSCSKIAYSKDTFYYTPDFKYAFDTRTQGTNYKKNSRSYLNRLGKYQKYFKLDLTDCYETKYNTIVDKINDKKLYLETDYQERDDTSIYYVSKKRNLEFILNKNYDYLTLVNGELFIHTGNECESKKGITNQEEFYYFKKEVKRFVAQMNPEYNKLYPKIKFDNYIEYMLNYIRDNEENWIKNIQNHINFDRVGCFSFGNRKNLKSPKEYYDFTGRELYVGKEHLSDCNKNFKQIKFYLENILFIIWVLRDKMKNKYLICYIYSLLFEETFKKIIYFI